MPQDEYWTFRHQDVLASRRFGHMLGVLARDSSFPDVSSPVGSTFGRIGPVLVVSAKAKDVSAHQCLLFEVTVTIGLGRHSSIVYHTKVP